MNRRDWRELWRREWYQVDRAEAWFIALSVAVLVLTALIALIGITPTLALLS